MENQEAKDYILELWTSDKFNKEAFYELPGVLKYDSEDSHIGYIAEIIRRQYNSLDITAIFTIHKIDEIIDFLNRFVCCGIENKKCRATERYHLSSEELEEFEMLAKQASELSKVELSKTAPVLTTRTYLEMCRVAYDAIHEWEYPEEISTTFLFCEARMWSYRHEYEEGILGIDWDSPEQFARYFPNSYHSEELFFGGPIIYIKNESACIRGNCYTTPKKYEQWTGYTYSKTYDPKTMYQTVKMYIALRKKGYPIYYQEYEKVVSKLREEQ